jgi:hypothetical protein
LNFFSKINFRNLLFLGLGSSNPNPNPKQYYKQLIKKQKFLKFIFEKKVNKVRQSLVVPLIIYKK